MIYPCRSKTAPPTGSHRHFHRDLDTFSPELLVFPNNTIGVEEETVQSLIPRMRNKCLPASSETETATNRNVFQQHGCLSEPNACWLLSCFWLQSGRKTHLPALLHFCVNLGGLRKPQTTPLPHSSEPKNRKDFRNVEIFDSNICFPFLTPVSTCFYYCSDP